MAISASSALSDHSTTTFTTMAFRRAHCLADQQLTPPSSPDAPYKRLIWHSPKLQLPRVLRKGKLRKSTRSNNTFDPLAGPLVPTMREPFPLLLPASPVDTEYSSSSNASPIDPPELRRVSASYQDLRSLAARHSVSKPLQPTTPLLPSPIIRDLFEQEDALFPFHNPRPTRDEGEYRSYEDLHILSCYYDDNKTASLDDIERDLEDVNVSETILSGDDGDIDSTVFEDLPQTPTNRPERDTFGSAESGWLANATTPSERVWKFKARCYQVMQHPVDCRNDHKDENAIMLATVLVGPGKPKVVQISRHSSDVSPKELRRNQPSAPPQTPTKYCHEISAFSPYDTPPNVIDHCIRPSSSQSTVGTATPKASYSSTSLVPAPLSVMTRTRSYQSSSTTFSNTREHLHSLADPFGTSSSNPQTNLPRRSSSVSALPNYPSGFPRSSSSYHHSYSLPPGRKPSPTFTSQARPATPDRNSQYRQSLPSLLATLTSAINSFTFHGSFSSSTALSTLHLSSSTIFDVRCPHIPDQHYIDMLGKIFPSAVGCGEALLSALVAWIIIDLQLCKAISVMKSRQQHQHLVNTASASTLCSRAPLLDMSWHVQEPHLHIRRKAVQPRGDAQHQYSYSTLVNQSNSSLHRIPTKARDLLGITLSPPPHRRGQCAGTLNSTPSQPDPALLHRAIAVQQSVSVIGQKLVETLRGVSGFDEDVWRGLRVLVEVVEEGGWATAGNVRPTDHEDRNGKWL